MLSAGATSARSGIGRFESESVIADLRADLTAVDRPVLVIHGDRDASAPAELGQRTAAAIPGARFSLYEGAPHGLFVTHATRINEELIASCEVERGTAPGLTASEWRARRRNDHWIRALQLRLF